MKSPQEATVNHRHFRRFDPLHRILHFFVIVSFLGLAATGLPLKYATEPWAHLMAQMMGGFQALAFFHRVGAVITFGYFFIHLFAVLFKVFKLPPREWFHFFFGPDSLVPHPRDVIQLYKHLRYFVGAGPRPRWERWTYWEKFDYWAVWWGVCIIGASGLVLWFPLWFAQFMPGWACNVAMIIHSDEALLAAGFIFTIHFFNCHFRPGKFPMDTVVFTGAVSEEELEEDHPAWYARMKESGELEARQQLMSGPDFIFVAKSFGFLALALGCVLAVLMIFAPLF